MVMHSHYDTSLVDVTSQTPELTTSPSGHRYLVGTRKRTIRDVNFIKGWFRSNGCLPDFETMSEADLNDQLCQFYLHARTKDDKPFTRTSLLGLRASLNRYLLSLPPGRKQWSTILKHPAFATSNRIMNRKSTEERNRDRPPKTVPISLADLNKLMSSKILHTSFPVGLQKKVWLDIVLHFGLRGNKAMWALTKNSFLLEVDKAGRQYYHLNHETELPKQEVYSEMKDWYWYSRMYEIADSPRCPVQSLSKYLQKLSLSCNEFFQRALESRAMCSGVDGDTTWYRGPMGDQAVMKMMSDMSRFSSLSRIYTNTSVRSTLDELLGKQGVVLDVLFMQKGEPITSDRLEFKSNLIHNAFYTCEGEHN
ncbi:uncharacterized protein LOC132565677 [Ylistrum balloti]|uniref:uncharacterized protein LOC132565677 n=1 Tax=Ylistrum balloti TaxID=509963 RepID=UPI002905DF45|nr:uncharacterized protein LOC132565677 [Ylistrum balloti]